MNYQRFFELASIDISGMKSFKETSCWIDDGPSSCSSHLPLLQMNLVNSESISIYTNKDFKLQSYTASFQSSQQIQRSLWSPDLHGVGNQKGSTNYYFRRRQGRPGVHLLRGSRQADFLEPAALDVLSYRDPLGSTVLKPNCLSHSMSLALPYFHSSLHFTDISESEIPPAKPNYRSSHNVWYLNCCLNWAFRMCKNGVILDLKDLRKWR